MILPIHRLVRAPDGRTAVSRLYAIAADDPVLAAIPVEVRAAPRAGRPRGPARLRARAPAAQGAAGHRPGDRRRRSAPSTAFSRIEAAPNGYVNFFLDRPAVRRRLARRAAAAACSLTAGKAIVEHTAINPNKAAHIGHLRNAALGDAFGRLLRFLGRQVEIQNYIDDTGVQVADVAVGFRELEHKTLDEVRTIADAGAVRLLLLGPLRPGHRMVRGRQGAAEDPDRGAARHRARRQPTPPTLAAFIADRIVRAPPADDGRMNIGYDLLTWEGDILRLHFWTHAFEFLKKTGAVFLQTEGKLKGCWVMRIDDDAGCAAGDPRAATPDG